MLIYKVLRARRMGGASTPRARPLGAPVDLADGFVHFSTAAQLAETARAALRRRDRARGSSPCDADAARRRRCAGSRRAAARSSRTSTGRSRARTSLWARPLPLARTGRRSGRARMSLGERLALPLLRRLDPETAHGLALAALRAGLGPRAGRSTSPRLAHAARRARARRTRSGSPPGFDKNADARSAPLRRAPASASSRSAPRRRGRSRATRGRGSSGSPRTGRRSTASASTTTASAAIAARLAARPPGGVVGLNLGANKASADRAADYAAVLAQAGPFVDFATVNVSSPNTERLRELQGAAALAGAARRRHGAPTPRWPGRCRCS